MLDAKVAFFILILTFVLTMGLQPNSARSGTPFGVLTGDIICVGETAYCLESIISPELRQICEHGTGRDFDCRHIVKTALMNLFTGSIVKCSAGVKQEPYVISSCEASSLNLVHTSSAFSTESRFANIQPQAKEKKHGLCKGNFDTPWVWRELQKQR
jgi:hypothetical protein